MTALDLAGTLLWHRDFPGNPIPPRIGGDGTVWVAHRGPDGAAFTGLSANTGSTIRTVRPEHDPSEHLGALAILPDGFCASWLPADRFHVIPKESTARVARHDIHGNSRWSTSAPLGPLSYPGVVELSQNSRWRPEPKRPWNPRTIEAHHWEPLLVSSHRVAATFADSSGIAVTFLTDAESGELVAATEPAPSHHKAIIGPGEFLIGFQGYGAFSTTHYDDAGTALRTWPSHAMLLIDRHGAILGPESENRLPSRSHFARLEPDGTVLRGPALSGYYTSYPALDLDGTAVFWRDTRLLAVDRDFETRELLALKDEKRNIVSSILLLDAGRVAFALDNDVLIATNTGLAPLDDGIWPCANGGLGGNPVAYL